MAFLLAWVVFPSGISAQDEVVDATPEQPIEEPITQTTEEPTTAPDPVEDVPVETAVPETEETQIEEPAIPTDPPVEETAADPTDVALPATPVPTEASPTETVEPTPTPSLTYQLDPRPICKTVGLLPETIRSGSFLDYDCLVDIALNGSHVTASDVFVNWKVESLVESGWTVQLLPPLEENQITAQWTPDQTAIAQFAHKARLVNMTASDVPDSVSSDEQLKFGLRIERAACSTNQQPVTLRISAQVETTNPDTTKIELVGAQPEPFFLNPTLQPIPEPSISFGGSLDFGTIPIDASGVKQAPKPGTISVTVSGLDQACGNWTLGLRAAGLDGKDGSTIASNTLSLVSINDKSATEAGCPLDGGCPIAVIPAGPDAEPTATFTLGVSLVLPDQLRATTFNSKLTATLAREPLPST